MEDETVLRATAMICGVVVLLGSVYLGINSLAHTIAGALVGFGIGKGLTLVRNRNRGSPEED